MVIDAALHNMKRSPKRYNAICCVSLIIPRVYIFDLFLVIGYLLTRFGIVGFL